MMQGIVENGQDKVVEPEKLEDANRNQPGKRVRIMISSSLLQEKLQTPERLETVHRRDESLQGGDEEYSSHTAATTSADASSSNLSVRSVHHDEAEDPSDSSFSAIPEDTAPACNEKVITSSIKSHASNERSNSEERKKEKPPTLPPSYASTIRKTRQFAGKLVNNDRVQLFIIVLIIINSIMMGVATFDFATDNDKVRNAFEATDKAFLIVFTIELGLQAMYHGPHLVKDAWLLFDLVIVVTSWSLEGFQVVRAFRIFRTLRLITRLTVLRNLILAIFQVAPSMGAIIALLVLILYVYAVLCTEFFRDAFVDGITSEDYFSRLDSSLFTLFSMMTLEWADIVRELMEEYYWAWAVFGTFLVATSFILYSLVIAVICDAVAVTEHEEAAAIEAALLKTSQQETQERIRSIQIRMQDLTTAQYQTLTAVNTALLHLHGQDLKPFLTERSVSLANVRRISLEKKTEKSPRMF